MGEQKVEQLPPKEKYHPPEGLGLSIALIAAILLFALLLFFMWWIALGYCCFFFGTNFYLTWYPTYLREHRGLSVAALGLWGSIPLVAGMLGDVVGGSLSDM